LETLFTGINSGLKIQGRQFSFHLKHLRLCHFVTSD